MTKRLGCSESNTPMDSERSVLTELLRLYDWRNELGRIERDFNHDRKQMKTWLNQYGREKKAAWEVARQLIAAPQVPGNGAKADEGRDTTGTVIVNTPAGAAPVTRSASEAFKPTHQHAEGGLYQVLADERELLLHTGPDTWEQAIRYRNADGQEFVRSCLDFGQRFKRIDKATNSPSDSRGVK